MAERAGYTVTMFLIDVSSSMGRMREVETPLPNGETQAVEMTNLEWSMQFVKMKIQEMIYNGRKTDQCGVILFGTEETSNLVNTKDGGYDHVYEYIPVSQPNAGTLAKLTALQPSTEIGDPVDALIVGIETQHQYLAKKRTWTRKMVLLTDGENPIEIEDWEETAKKVNDLDIQLAIIGVDFDDDEYPFHEENKSHIKRTNEEFFHKFVDKLDSGIVGTCAFALEEVSRPDVKNTKSTLMATVLRMGDVEDRPEEAMEIMVKMSKCTALARPKSWKKFTLRDKGFEDISMYNTEEERVAVYAQLSMQTEYVVDETGDEDKDENKESEDDEKAKKEKVPEPVEKEELVRGYKYGSSYVPAPDGFPRLPTRKGMEICGFFPMKNFRHELEMGEVYYVFADPSSPAQQLALSSIVEAMYEKASMAITRWVSRDGMDPKMGVLRPAVLEDVDCFLWVQVPFADDVRRYTFASLDRLINKKGEVVTSHPYLPTDEQIAAMEKFVEDMDLAKAAEVNDEGEEEPWFDTRRSYNPAIHRTKQAQFHAAVVTDLKRQPLPPPHPELLKYFEPPRKLVKKAREATEEARQAFKVKEVPKRVARTRKDGHVHARDEDDTLLLDAFPPRKKIRQSQTQSQTIKHESSPRSLKLQSQAQKKLAESDSETEPESDAEELLLDKKPGQPPKAQDEENEDMLPTPARSESPEDNFKEPGRIIGTARPLQDFRENLRQGDLVTKSVEDLAYVIKKIISQPFASRRNDELFECLQALREIAVQEDEIDQWNEFLPDLKKMCTEEEPGNLELWTRVTEKGREMSLIGLSEAMEHGGNSDISDARAREFLPS